MTSFTERLKNPNGFLWIVGGYFLWYLVTEIGLTFLPGEYALIVWVPLHFVINPYVSLVASLAVLVLATTSATPYSVIIALAAGAVMIFLGVLGFTADPWLVDKLGLDFR